MPTYEDVCATCGHEFETFQPITAKPLARCPEALCAETKWGHGKVKRKIGAGAGVIFKGSGFYATDYRSDKYKAAARKESGAAASSTGQGKSPPSGVDGKPAKPQAASAKVKPAA